MDVQSAANLLPLFPWEEDVDWTYNMRREMQEIIPGLYLGPYSVASKSQLVSLTTVGVTHIVCVRQQMQASLIRPNFPHVFAYLVLDIDDSDMQNIIQYFPQVNNFILTCLRAGGKALVHGMTGCSRSATLVQAFIMMYCGLSSKDAFVYMQRRRYCVCPNANFLRQLEAYEPMCAAYRTQIPDQPAHQGQSRKRKWEEESTSDVNCGTMS